MNRDERQAARFVISRDALLTEATACELLPCRDVDAREWLRSEGLVRVHPVLGRVVLWADVLDAVRTGGAPKESAPRPPCGYPRAGIRRRR